MIDQLIWDAGGTLFDTYPAVVAACQSVLVSLGHRAMPDRLMELFRQTTAHALSTVATAYSLDLDELSSKFEEAYEATGPELQPPFPFVQEVCAYVVEVGGANYVVTHRGRASLTRLLTAHGLAALFADCITEEDPFPRKPDPASILALMRRNGLAPSRCLAIGDRDLDIVAGLRAGVMTCYFGTDSHETPADLEITSYERLLAWLAARAQCRV